MKTQNDIILETEIIVENCRQEMSHLKEKISNASFKECCIFFENILFEFTVLFYTHRTVWSNINFWNTYANAKNPMEFAQHSFKQMIQCTLINCYANLYFCIEGGIFQYLLQQGCKKTEKILEMYDKIDKTIIDDYEELKKGLKILRCIRNSFHGDNGNFIFKYASEEIFFKAKPYSFKKNKPVSTSYEFLREFIPLMVKLYKSLFN